MCPKPKVPQQTGSSWYKLSNVWKDLSGGRTRARTWDPMIKSHLLYQLSYAPGTGPESLRKRASFSKATLRCPANAGGFPCPVEGSYMSEKPAGFRRLFLPFRALQRHESRRSPAAFFG